MKRFSLFYVTVVLSLLFAVPACGGSSDSGDTGNSANTADSSDTANTGDTTDSGDTTDTADSGDTTDTAGEGLACDAIVACAGMYDPAIGEFGDCTKAASKQAQKEYKAYSDCVAEQCPGQTNIGCIKQKCGKEWEQCFSHHPAHYPKTKDYSYKGGSTALNITYYDTEWNFHQFADFYKTKKAIILVMSTLNCPYCIQEAGDMKEFVSQFGEDKVAVLEILLDSSEMFCTMDELKYWDKRYGKGTNYTGAPADFSAVFGYIDPNSQGLGTPYNVIIDGDTMEVMKTFEGYDQKSLQNIVDYLVNDD